MARNTVLVKFLISTCNYKAGQLKRVCPRIAKLWEKRRIAKIVPNQGKAIAEDARKICL